MNKQNKQGYFLAVIGVMTLVVSVFGATFAYFTAQATNDNAIKGQTLAIKDALKLDVSSVKFEGTTAKSPNLVPTNLSESNLNAVNAALTTKCEDNGYTGCHVYKITVSSTQEVANANLKLTLTTTAKVPSDWKYVVYTGTDTDASALVTGANGSFPVDSKDIHNAALGSTEKTYYVMIFIRDDETAQNSGDGNDATGNYTGSLVLSAAGGQVKANFTFQ